MPLSSNIFYSNDQVILYLWFLDRGRVGAGAGAAGDISSFPDTQVAIQLEDTLEEDEAPSGETLNNTLVDFPHRYVRVSIINISYTFIIIIISFHRQIIPQCSIYNSEAYHCDKHGGEGPYASEVLGIFL